MQPVNPRSRKILPYFPGYLFIHIDLIADGTSTFQRIPYSTGLVSFGGEPALVPDAIIHEMRQRIGDVVSPADQFSIQRGENVQIQTGPLAGFDAIFDTCIPGTERARILLTLLNQGRNIPVELPVGYILPKKRPTGPASR